MNAKLRIDVVAEATTMGSGCVSSELFGALTAEASAASLTVEWVQI